VGDDADTWWATLTPERRAQIHHWVASPRSAPPDLPGQLTLEDLPPDHTQKEGD